MKRIPLYVLIVLTLVCLFTSCETKITKSTLTGKSPTPNLYTYSESLEVTTKNYKAPALQSFIHASNGNDWLLLTERTSEESILGELHDINTKNDSLNSLPKKSFIPLSYTSTPETNSSSILNYWNILNTILSIAKNENNKSEDIQEVWASKLNYKR
jgi:hypothetical protein